MFGKYFILFYEKDTSIKFYLLYRDIIFHVTILLLLQILTIARNRIIPMTRNTRSLKTF